jgi:hypothetical protein
MPVSDLVVELELSTHALAGIYRAQEWPLALCAESTPTAADLAELITHVSLASLESESGSYVTLGRVLAVRDAEFPDVVELALFIGTARLSDDADPDGPPPANRFTASNEGEGDA